MRLIRMMAIIVFLLFSQFADSPAQDGPLPEQPDLGTLFEWFPALDYDNIYHFNQTALTTTEGGALFLDYTASWWPFYDLLPLPPSMADRFASWTCARIARYRISPYRKGEDLEFRSGMNRVGGKEFRMENVGAHLMVWRFDDLKRATDSAIKAGELKPLATIVRRSPVYEFHWSSEGTSHDNWFAWSDGDQSLLVCEDLAMLRTMIAAGHGEESSCFDTPEFSLFLKLKDQLGNVFHAINYRAMNRIEAQQMRNQGIDKELADAHEQMMEAGNPFNIRTYIVGEGLQDRTFYIFSDTERAEKSKLSTMSSPMSIPMNGTPAEKLNALRHNNTVKRIDDGIITITRTITREMVDLTQLVTREREERLKEKQKMDEKKNKDEQ